MKQIALLLIFITPFLSNGQDTISSNTRYQGGETFLIKMNLDTFFICTYPSGKIESKRPHTISSETTTYIRYYENGNKLWQREMKQGKANGTSFFYTENGKIAASLVFKNDTLVDTNYINPKYFFVYGRATYYSIVHGGMQREDGSSNISGGPGTYMFSHFYTVKLDPKMTEQTIYKKFDTDYNGYYFVVLEKGDFGFFPQYQDIKLVTAKMGAQWETAHAAVSGGWNIKSPVIIKDQNFNQLDLHYHSVGYAP